MRVENLLSSFTARASETCLIWRGQPTSFADVEARRREWLEILDTRNVGRGAVIGIKAGYSVPSVSLLLALLSRGCIAALIPQNEVRDDPFLDDGEIEGLFRFSDTGEWTWQDLGRRADHPLIDELRRLGHAGLTIYSSGSSGRPKAILHSAERFLSKFDRPGKPLRTLAFLLFDHIAGLDTLFYTLTSGGTLVLPERRDPQSICALIQDHRVEVLPASPAFLNLLCLSRVYEGFDLSNLKIITYGSEPMNDATLDQVCRIFPGVKIIQKYGTSEFGAPRARSRGNDSLWIKLKTDELDAKVVDGMLWVRTKTAMMGYLNAPNPFDEDGWYCTGDLVEREGDWIRILGRQSDIIVVGGEKVYPQEVETAILELDEVDDVLVKGEAHALLGQMVTARVVLSRPMDERMARKQIRRHCRARLAPYKVPSKVEIADGPLTTERQKKVRR